MSLISKSRRVWNPCRRKMICCLAAIGICYASTAATQDDEDVARRTLQAITISNPSFHLSKSGFSSRKIFSFTVKNGSKTVIKTLYFHAKLQTPGRKLPWIESDQNYTFPGGLESGEARRLDLAPNMFGEWGQAEDEWIKTGVFSISVLSVDDAEGHKIGPDSRPESAK